MSRMALLGVTARTCSPLLHLLHKKCGACSCPRGRVLTTHFVRSALRACASARACVLVYTTADKCTGTVYDACKPAEPSVTRLVARAPRFWVSYTVICNFQPPKTLKGTQNARGPYMTHPIYCTHKVHRIAVTAGTQRRSCCPPPP